MDTVKNNKKIGVFSGTFDPVHNGHIRFVEEAIDLLQLDEVLVLIEKEPRRKHNVTSYPRRVAMAKLAFNNPKVTINLTKDSGAAHTVDETMGHIIDYVGSETEIWILLGGDVIEYVPRWDNYERLLSTVHFLVSLRGEDDGEVVVGLKSSELEDADIIMIQSLLPLVSSSRIRNAFRSGQAPDEVNDAVTEYIQTHRLYSESYDGK